MDLKSGTTSPVLAETAQMNKSRLGFRPNLFQCSATAAVFSPGFYVTVPRKKTGVRDDGRSNGWLDAMAASSPPPKMITKEAESELAATDPDIAYKFWKDEYPSALVSFDRITTCAKGKRIVLFLDYDGTLSPIVDNPDCAFMSDYMRSAVRMAAKCFPTAIISGRSRDKVFEFVRLTELFYAGSHGMDIMGPVRHSSSEDHPNSIKSTDKQMQGNDVNLFQPASEFLPTIDKVYDTLVEATKVFDGAKVENNKFCVSVHYRNVDQKHWNSVGNCVSNILKDYPRLRITYGRKVLEVRPVINWDKGKAVMFLLESLGLSNREDVLPIYVGDDKTDEDAFKVLREGNRGFGILVSSKPKESSASYSLKDPPEVMEFLKSLVSSKASSAL